MKQATQYCFQRYEKKYALSFAQQQALLQRIGPYLRPDDYGTYTICNIYYDTGDWRLIRASIEKPAYKEKLRVRSYGTPGPEDKVFVELKKKFDGVVYKRRVTMEAGQAEDFLTGRRFAEQYGQIGREITYFQEFYGTRPRVFIAYDRLAFAGVEDPGLRVTFDSGLRWRDTQLDLRMGDYGAPISAAPESLLELKLSGACPLWLSSALSAVGAFPTSFSKYGACYCWHLLPKAAAEREKEVRFCA